MNKNTLRAAYVAALMSTAALAGAMTLTSPAALAAGPTVGKAVGAQLQTAQKAMQAGDWQGALAATKAAQAVPDQNDYETYEINKFLSIEYINLKDMPNATVAAEAAADSPGLQDEDKKDIYHNALLLAVQAQQYQKAITYGQNLEKLGPLDDTLNAMMAVAYYNLKDTANAQKYAQQSIDASKAAGKQPNQNALEIMMSSQAKTNQGAAQATLEQIAVNYNNPTDWGQLIDLALSTKGIRSADAIFLFRLRVLTGAMKNPEDYTLTGSIAEQLGYPTEAVNAYQAGINAGKITSAQAGATFAKARTESAQDQRALSGIAAAAEKSKTGEQDVKLAEDYWGYGRYADVETAARRAIAKGGLKNPQEGQMMLGTALVAQGKYDEAQTTLAGVTSPPALAKAAHLWSLYAQALQKKAGATQPAPATH